MGFRSYFEIFSDDVLHHLDLAPSTAKSTEHPTSLPSTEVHGDASGKSGGVGSLPGTINEESVAKLPEERAADGTLRDTTEVGSGKVLYMLTIDPSLSSFSICREEANTNND